MYVVLVDLYVWDFVWCEWRIGANQSVWSAWKYSLYMYIVHRMSQSTLFVEYFIDLFCLYATAAVVRLTVDTRFSHSMGEETKMNFRDFLCRRCADICPVRNIRPLHEWGNVWIELATSHNCDLWTGCWMVDALPVTLRKTDAYDFRFS